MASEPSKEDLLLAKLDETSTKLDGLKLALQQFIKEEVDRQVNDRGIESKGQGGHGTV